MPPFSPSRSQCLKSECEIPQNDTVEKKYSDEGFSDY